MHDAGKGNLVNGVFQLSSGTGTMLCISTLKVKKGPTMSDDMAEFIVYGSLL